VRTVPHSSVAIIPEGKNRFGHSLHLLGVLERSFRKAKTDSGTVFICWASSSGAAFDYRRAKSVPDLGIDFRVPMAHFDDAPMGTT